MRGGKGAALAHASFGGSKRKGGADPTSAISKNALKGGNMLTQLGVPAALLYANNTVRFGRSSASRHRRHGSRHRRSRRTRSRRRR
jgi:hypothetical protein